LTVLGPFVAGFVLLLLAATLTTGSRLRRGLGIALALAALLPAWLVPPGHTLVRPIWVLFSFVGVMRSTDLGRMDRPIAGRLIHVVSVVDTRRLRRAPPAVDGLALRGAAAWEAAALAGWYGVSALGPPASAAAWVARWAFALLFVYAFSAGAYLLLAAAYRAFGFVTPALHVAPLASRSVQEFWGERWNLTVSRWLGETFFRPLARRRRPIRGALLAFLASALLHAYIAWIAVGVRMGLWSLAFFLAQGGIILLERRLVVRRWAPWAGHAWTVAWMTLLSPLFTEPMVRAMGR
jgi:hypothetical protein